MPKRRARVALAMGLALVLFAPRIAPAISLAELVADGETLTSGNGLTFSGFEVKKKGKASSRHLELYQVTATEDGFILSGPAGTFVKHKITLSYDVSGPAGLEGAALALGFTGKARGKARVKQELYGHTGKVDKLRVAEKTKRNLDESVFDAVFSLRVKEKISVKGDVFQAPDGELLRHSFAAVPEPISALLVGSGLVGLALLGRRRPR